MPGLMITRGLPGSGKTTVAREWVAVDPASRVRISRDDRRAEMHGGRLGTRAQEEQVTVATEATIAALLRAGLDVVHDAIHLDPEHVAAMQELAFDAGANFGVVDMTDVPLEVCIDRDLIRAASGDRYVGEAVIRRMHEQWVADRGYPLPIPKPVVIEPYVEPAGLYPRVVLVDVDGTAALRGDRSPYDETRVVEDLPNQPVLRAVRMYAERGARVIFVSARSEKCRIDTTEWLATFFGTSWEALLMRPAGDTRRDWVVKHELFNQHVRGRYRVLAVFDDRNQVVRMWRQMGLTVFQVADGNF